MARKMVSICAKETDGGSSHCYEREVPALYPKYSIGQIFDIIRQIRLLDPSYQFCHVLGHKLGERLVAEDPEHWMDLLSLNPTDSMCSSGFTHGVVSERFRSEVLTDDEIEKTIPDFKRACEPSDRKDLSGLDQAMCYHGLGHLFFFITDANIEKALEICERTAYSQTQWSDFRRVCYEGVFMQIYQQIEPDDFLLVERMSIKPSTTTVRRYCARFTNDAYESACLRESWVYSRDEIMSGTGVVKFCSGQPSHEAEIQCYDTATSLIGGFNLSEPEKAAKACDNIPSEWRALCYTAAARGILEEDYNAATKAVAMCERAKEGNIVNECLSALVDLAEFIVGDGKKHLQSFCAAFPAEFKYICLQLHT